MGDVPWNLLDTALAFLLFVFASLLVGGALLFGLTRVAPGLDVAGASLPISLAMLGVSAMAWIRLRYPGRVRLLFGPGSPTLGRIAIGLGAGLAAFLVLTLGVGWIIRLVIETTGGTVPEVQEDLRELATQPRTAPYVILGAGVVAPLAEELFYRGMLFAAMRRRFSLWPAAGLSSVVFALSHLQSSLDGYILVIAIILPLGIFLAWLYERTGTLAAPMAAHAAYNLVQVILLVTFGDAVSS